MRRARVLGTSRHESRKSAICSSAGQAWAGAAGRNARASARKRRDRMLLDDPRLEADLAVLRLESEIHRLGALLGEDAHRLLGDQLLEALELDCAGLAGGAARVLEAIEQLAHGLAVELGAFDPDLATARRRHAS